MGIVLRLRGGLGNQLFQSIAGAHYARKFSSELYLDDVAIIRHQNYTRRSWLREIDINELFNEPLIHWKNRVCTYARASLWHKYKNIDFLEEQDLNALELVPRNAVIHDWFQNRNYLPQKRPFLNTKYLRNLSSEAKKLSALVLEAENLAAIHVRLGDFAGTSWGTLPFYWYRNALNLLVSQGVNEIHCYSDNLPEAKRILESNISKCKLTFPEEKTQFRPHELLWILTQYKNYASSNSSLSWWASYLNGHANPFIISPWGKNLHENNWTTIEESENRETK